MVNIIMVVSKPWLPCVNLDEEAFCFNVQCYRVIYLRDNLDVWMVNVTRLNK